jgi:glutamine amidotransferase
MAYRGAPIQVSELVLDSQHSIVAQSLDSPLGAETVNGDGFGLGWYGDDPGLPPGRYRSTEPAWNDQNLSEIAHAVRSGLFLCHVRAAAGPPIQETNCHPFVHGRWMLVHNGTVHGWPALRRDLMLEIDPDRFADVHGTTDTETLFHLALTLGLEDDPAGALARAIGTVERIGRAHGITFPWQGTVCVTDGSTLWAVRYSSEGRTRTLFHSNDIPTLRQLYPSAERLELFSDDAYVVVSEPFTDLPGVFTEVPESTILVVDGDGMHHEAFAPVG